MSAAVEFEVGHTDAGVRRASLVLWDARHRRSMWTSFAVAAAAAAVGVATGGLPWYLAIVVAAAIAHAGFLAWHRGRVTRLASSELSRARPPVFRYRLHEGGLAETSSVGSVELPWSAFAGWRVDAGFLYLLRSPLAAGRFIALPLEQVPDAAAALVREHVPAG